jgi:hypothetical protein
VEVKVHHEQEISATQDAQTGITCQEAHRIVASHQYWVFIGDHPAFDELQRHYFSNAPEDSLPSDTATKGSCGPPRST